MDTRKWSIAWSSRAFWTAEDFAKTPEVDADAGETQLGFIRWLTMPSWMAQCYYNVFMITSELRDSVRLELQSFLNLKISLIVCPSGVNVGTRWGLLWDSMQTLTICEHLNRSPQNWTIFKKKSHWRTADRRPQNRTAAAWCDLTITKSLKRSQDGEVA